MIKLNPFEQFEQDIKERVSGYKSNKRLQTTKQSFHDELFNTKYAYSFYWLGVPIIQEPQDLQAWQELIWETKPNLIIETGVAWGGSVVFSASMLTILETIGQINDGRVVGVDIEIRPHNKQAIAAHPMSNKISLIEGSSIDKDVFNKVKNMVKTTDRVMVILDSNHTHKHVLRELELYSKLVSVGSYLIVADTGLEDLPKGTDYRNRPFGKNNNPKTAVWEFLKRSNEFEINKLIEEKLLLTCSPDGFLKKIK